VTLVCAHADVAANAPTKPANILIMHRFPKLARNDSDPSELCKPAQPAGGPDGAAAPDEIKWLDTQN
jgi:hypothetical protein